MNFSANQGATSNPNNSNVKEDNLDTEDTSTTANSSTEIEGAIIGKKHKFPNTFTTPQNCFELLNSTSNKLISAAGPISQTYSVGVKALSSLASPQEECEKDTVSENKIEKETHSEPESIGIRTTESCSLKACGSTEPLNPVEGKTSIQNIQDTSADGICSGNESQSKSNEEDSQSKFSENTTDFIRAYSLAEPSSDKAKNVSRLSERAKKKSWYNVLYPNYKTRSQEFKRLFKEVPAEERLIVDYSCALYRDLLIQGRLYISQNYVCFHANILGWETCLVIKWKDVTSITKEKTALVIPNAISIRTLTENYFFSSFTTRDKTFLILFRVWQNTLMNKPMLAQEVWELVHSYYGDELGLTTDDEDYVDPRIADENDGCAILEFVSAIDETPSISLESQGSSNIYIFRSFSNKSGSSNYSSNSTSSSGGGGAGSAALYQTSRETKMKSNAKELTLISAKPEEGTATNVPGQNNANSTGNDGNADRNSSSTPGKESKHNSVTSESKRKVSKNSRAREETTSKNVETLPTDISDSSDSEGTNIPFVATTECTSPHEGRQLVHTILPINIETLFNLLFSKSKFLLDFHAVRKSTDLVFGDWVRNDEGQRTRTVNVTVTLAASVGPKTSKVTEYQVMRDCSKQGELYSIDVNNVNAGIPYADSFSVLIHYCLVKTVDDHTMLSVHAQIKYKKSIWGVVKGFIEKNTWAGLEDFYGALLQALQSETCIPPAKGKGRRPRRGTAVQIRPLEDIPQIQSKPEPLEHLIGAQAVTSRSTAEIPDVIADTTNKHRWLSLFVLVLLCFLIIVNVILLLKLWRLEDRLEEDVLNRARLPNLAALKKLPNNHEDWIDLLRQQEMLHEAELRKWHTVLQTAIELLKKTEKTLAELMFR
ncbi:protein Aster-B isoform X1 [Musca domestica]|uniref:Protein Aster-B isoform X1 n=1 Tax=Musca domestica TaxID=7370 RepID=A0A9J7HWX7_MUSDO|nr:protein Aster-B isoform X1 [Musca domestica]